MRQVVVALLALALAVPIAAFASVNALVDPPSTLDVTIVRDLWGVPHVYADDAYSLFWGNGYAQAQDRLAQMEILRHVGKGELAKLTGPSGLALDLVTRRELYTDAEREAALAALDPFWRAAFEGYADGVNAWIAEVRTDPSKLPVEYPALAVAPADWDEKDTIAIAQYLLDVFGRGSGGQEVANARMLAELEGVLGAEAAGVAFDDLVWVRSPHGTYATIKPEDGAFDPLPAERAPDRATFVMTPEQAEARAAAESAALVDDSEATLGEAAAAAGWPFRFGSNAQLIAGRFAANGKPLLFGGPQMGYYTPMIPYELGLHGAGFDAVGMGVAGTPGVIIGRNLDMSWTVTSGASDQVDTVAEKLVPGTRDRYYVDGEELQMDCRTETHLVRPGPPDFVPGASMSWRPPLFDVVEQEVCRTIHGPVLYRSADGAYAFTSQRSFRGDEVRSGAIWLQIGSIRSLADFEALFDSFSFTFNFNFATEDGHIAYYHVGRQPLRDERLDPRLPRPGWDSSFEWKGFATLQDLPHVVDPASGYTVNWNNLPAAGWASGDARELWGAIHRAELMDETLAPLLARGDVTLDDLREANERASTHEPFADDLASIMRAAAEALDEASAVAAIDLWAASGFDYADRDADGFHDDAAFRLYELWAERYNTRVFADELGPFTATLKWDPPTGDDPHAADHGAHDNKLNVLVDAEAGRTGRAWCDDATTPAVETCLDQATAAMRDALDATTTRHCGSGACAPAPDWSTPLPQRMIKSVALGAGPSYEIPMVNRPSFQHFYDWGLPEGDGRSRNVLPPGASGHLSAADFLRFQAASNGAPAPFGALPPHLLDQLQMYVAFEDKPLLFDRGTLEDAYESSRLVIGP